MPKWYLLRCAGTIELLCLLLLTIFHAELIPSASPQTSGATMLEIWLIIPLFPGGILLGWGEKTNVNLLTYLCILECIKFLMENYKHNIIKNYIFRKISVHWHVYIRTPV